MMAMVYFQGSGVLGSKVMKGMVFKREVEGMMCALVCDDSGRRGGGEWMEVVIHMRQENACLQQVKVDRSKQLCTHFTFFHCLYKDLINKFLSAIGDLLLELKVLYVCVSSCK